MEWTEANAQALRRLWGEGRSASEIGQILGCSKNAVISKRCRLKLPERGSPIRARLDPAKPRKQQREETRQEAAARRLADAQMRAAQVEAERAEHALRRAEARMAATGPVSCCRWPIGDPRDAGFRFCVGVAVPGRPYCAEHMARAYLPRGEAA